MTIYLMARQLKPQHTALQTGCFPCALDSTAVNSASHTLYMDFSCSYATNSMASKGRSLRRKDP